MTVFIYGPPASGKTTIGEKIARELGCEAEFLDLDLCIEQEAGASIPEIFKMHGESWFRELESKVLAKIVRDHTISSSKTLVLSLGGGALLDKTSRELCESSGTVFCLEPPTLEELERRIASRPSSRPLGNRLAERAMHYASFTHRFQASNIEPVLKCARKPKI